MENENRNAMKMLDLKELENFSITLANHAGKILLKQRNLASIVTKKTNSLDFATTADIASEKYLRNEINHLFPSHGILGEEEGTTNVGSVYTWIIDPLDGTLDYKRGMPYFNVHVALEYQGQIMIGCVYCPMTGEIYSSSRGYGVRKNNVSISVSKIHELHESIIRMKLPRVTISKLEIDKSIRILHSLAEVTGLIRDGWECGMALAEIASGSIEAYIVPRIGPKWWDVAPGILMVEEAGGKVTDMYGNSIVNRDLSKGLVASNGIIHNKILDIVQKGGNYGRRV